MNKLNILFLFIVLNTDYLHCMKRTPELTTVGPSKRQKNHANQPAIQNIPLNIPFTHQSFEFLEECNKKLYIATQNYIHTVVQIHYIDAVKNKDIHSLNALLQYNPQQCLLESATALEFTEGVYAILNSGKATPQELNASLKIAIAKTDLFLTDALLEKGAQLDTINPMIRKVLNENKIIFNLVTQYSANLIGAVNAGLEDVVRAILRKNNPHQSQLNHSLHIAAQQQNLSLATMLIEAGADIDSCI